MSVKWTAWGLPIETQVTGTVRSPSSTGIVFDDIGAVFQCDGHLGGAEPGRAHGGSDGRDAAIATGELNLADSAKGLDYQPVFRCGYDTLFDYVLGEHADSVAAGFGFGAVGVVDLHAAVGHVGVPDEEDAVAADAEMAVTDVDGDSGPVFFDLSGVDENVVVADAVHLGEADGHGA